jgi:hypothetical protein
MAKVRKNKVFLALTGAVLAMLGACKPRHEPLPSVEDLMDDRVMRDGILLKCSDPATSATMGARCEIARIAVDRLARQDEAAEAAKRQEEFERNREKLRTTDEARAAIEAKQKQVDPYTLPVVPVTPAASAAAPPGNP